VFLHVVKVKVKENTNSQKAVCLLLLPKETYLTKQATVLGSLLSCLGKCVNVFYSALYSTKYLH
jgi:hypothetical protein